MRMRSKNIRSTGNYRRSAGSIVLNELFPIVGFGACVSLALGDGNSRIRAVYEAARESLCRGSRYHLRHGDVVALQRPVRGPPGALRAALENDVAATTRAYAA